MPSPKILIVDDHIGSLQTLIGLLEKYQPEYRLYQSTNGRAAVDLIISNAIDLVISDWDMPGFSGIDLLDAVKSEEKTRHIPVIMVTGVMVSSTDIHTALSRGAHDYLRKPVDPVELSARVHSAFTLSCCHTREIEQKNVELVEKALILTRNKEFITDLVNQLQKLIPVVDENTVAREALDKIIRETEQKLHYESWQQFDIAFQNVHKSFVQNLLGTYPDLTPAEIKLAILIKLGLSSKEMASLLNQTNDSLKVSRSRLRKKMNLENDTNLFALLATY